ncbi:MAG: DUF1667 domain-containing protein [Clostridia bacterium]|nr:DUF1667 domain-containing protein [Clostridia bacterium]
MKQKILCVRCPVGCRLTVELKDKTVVSVTGNQCRNGAEYAKSECTAPVRTLTTLVKSQSGPIPVPVRTDIAIPKNLIAPCLALIGNIVAPAGTKQGDVLVANALDTGANIVATRDDWN